MLDTIMNPNTSMTTPGTGAPPSKALVEDVADLPPRVRLYRALRALAGVLADPERTDLVLEFSNLINAGRRDDRLHFFFDDPAGAKLYAERRAIDSKTVDLDQLAALPADTLGHAYATFMSRTA